MSCLMKNCNIKSDNERKITCWLCHELCHVKCSGLSGLVVDAMANDKGLHWRCNDCRKIGVTFYRFFQDTFKKFLEIQEEASKLTERISEYGKLFDDFKSLDNLKSPPQSSPKRRKSSRNKDKHENPVASTSSLGFPSLNFIPEPIRNNAEMPLDCVYESSKTPASFINSDQTETALVNTDGTPNPPAPVPNSDQTVHSTLRAVSPKKTVFVSRLAVETTSEAVTSYINSKVGPDADVSTYKFNFSQQRSITSFKITVAADLFERILDPQFWPENTLVREYTYREKPRSNIGHLPQHEMNVPKN